MSSAADSLDSFLFRRSIYPVNTTYTLPLNQGMSTHAKDHSITQAYTIG